eukprot:Rhum_TRINITY_DN22922_c0_g1::Rhum_TRINITY_DN22922_c0_g1_i1::g.176531::m.176531
MNMHAFLSPLSRGARVSSGQRRCWSLAARDEVDVQGIIDSLKKAPVAAKKGNANRLHKPEMDKFGPDRRGGPLATDQLRCDADAAFYIKCRFLGRTSRWMTYQATVELRNQLYRVLSRFRRAGLAGEEVFTAAILFFTCLGMGPRAHAVFDMAMEDGIRPNSRMYNFLLGAYANQGKWQMVYQLWVQMVRNDILPTPHSFNLLLRAQQKGGNKLEVFELMELTSEIMKPNSMTWTILLAATTNYWEASKIVQDMKRHDILPDNRTIGAILDSCVLTGDINNAELVARLAEREWGIPFTTGVYNVLMNAYKEIGDYEGVIDAFKRMQAAGCRPDTLSYNLLITTSALSLNTRMGRTAFIEADVLAVSRTLHMNTGITAVFGYAGDCDTAQKCWESRPGRGPSAKRTEPQVANMRECYITTRLMSYKNPTEALMSELYRLRDPSFMSTANPYIVQAFLRMCLVLRGWGVKPMWRVMCQTRTPKMALSSVDTRRHQAILHIALDHHLCVAVYLWIHDHRDVSPQLLQRADARPDKPTGIVHLDLVEDVFERALKRGPGMAAKLIGPLIASYSVLGLVERSKRQFKRLLEANAAVRHLYPHLKVMRDIYTLAGDVDAAEKCGEFITEYHNGTLWKKSTASVIKALADDGVKPSKLTFALIREKQAKAQQLQRRKKRDEEMIIKQVPGVAGGQEDFLIGVVSDQLPFISTRLNNVQQPTGESETVASLLSSLAREEAPATGLARDSSMKESDLPLTTYLERSIDGTLENFYSDEPDKTSSPNHDLEADEYSMPS